MGTLKIDDIEKMEKSFLTVSEAAEILEISKNSLYRLLPKMNFPIKRIGRKIIIPRKPFLEYLKSERNELSDEP